VAIQQFWHIKILDCHALAGPELAEGLAMTARVDKSAIFWIT